MTLRPGSHAGGLDGELEERGVGLPDAELVGDPPDLEERLEPVASHRGADLSRLVGDHAEPVATAQLLEARDHVVVERGGRIVPVAGGERLQFAEIAIRQEPCDEPAPERSRLLRTRPRVFLLELGVR